MSRVHVPDDERLTAPEPGEYSGSWCTGFAGGPGEEGGGVGRVFPEGQCKLKNLGWILQRVEAR